MLSANIISIIFVASAWVIPALLAITLHEAAHGWAAAKLGDDTALRLGRVTFNPLRHVDPVGTILVPAILLLVKAPFLFGWAKPVPVDFGRLYSPRRDMALVALAGPGVNLAMAFIAALLGHAVPVLADAIGDTGATWFLLNLENAIQLNLILCLFNMIPLPPLDGGRVAVGWLPLALARPLARVEPYGMMLVFGLIVIVPLIASQFGSDFNPLSYVLIPMVEGLRDILLVLAGHSD